MGVRTVGGLVAVAIAAAVFLGRGMFQRENLDSKYLTEAYALVEHCDQYRKHQGYIIGICESVHEEAFRQSFSPGGRRRSAKFNEGQYFSELFKRMRERAITDGQYEVAESISKLGEEFRRGEVQLVPAK